MSIDGDFCRQHGRNVLRAESIPRRTRAPRAEAPAAELITLAGALREVDRVAAIHLAVEGYIAECIGRGG